MKRNDSLEEIAGTASARLRKHRIRLTLGGEPSYVPIDPSGAEWQITAVGPTKLRYAYELAGELMSNTLKGAVAILSPGKCYPGEPNPRWALNILWNRNSSPIDTTTAKDKAPTAASLSTFRSALLKALKLEDCWLPARDVQNGKRVIWVLPLDHSGRKWHTEKWPFGRRRRLALLNAEGPAGLRLPLNLLPADALKRALVVDVAEDGLHLFFLPCSRPPSSNCSKS